VLIRDIDETDEGHGRDPWQRPLKELLRLGVVVIDKPAGPTSHQVSEWAKRIAGARKAGHSGTLDPAVTGVLPVLLNESTKVVPALLKAGKEYVGVMHLHGDVPEDKVRGVAQEFEGEITQLPPVRSAVKRAQRQRHVYSFAVLEVSGRDVLFRTSVEAGTYVRKLCHDMGGALGVGAHMSGLRRTRAGPFTEATAVTLQELSEAFNLYRETGDESLVRRAVRPVEDCAMLLPKVYVRDSAVDSLAHGASLGVAGVSMVEESVRPGRLTAVLTKKGELVCLGVSHLGAKDMAELWEGDAVRTQRVVMKPGTYKKTW
jgi:H/ACA ribonucleoprotein complex subunit 4